MFIQPNEISKHISRKKSTQNITQRITKINASGFMPWAFRLVDIHNLKSKLSLVMFFMFRALVKQFRGYSEPVIVNSGNLKALCCNFEKKKIELCSQYP